MTSGPNGHALIFTKIRKPRAAADAASTAVKGALHSQIHSRLMANAITFMQNSAADASGTGITDNGRIAAPDHKPGKAASGLTRRTKTKTRAAVIARTR